MDLLSNRSLLPFPSSFDGWNQGLAWGLEEQQWREREVSSGLFATVGSEEEEQVTVWDGLEGYLYPALQLSQGRAAVPPLEGGSAALAWTSLKTPKCREKDMLARLGSEDVDELLSLWFTIWSTTLESLFIVRLFLYSNSNRKWIKPPLELGKPSFRNGGSSMVFNNLFVIFPACHLSKTH
jgi:hypothetical protein